MMIKNGMEKRNCIVCQREYISNNTNRERGKRRFAIRMKRSVTCSKECSKIYSRIFAHIHTKIRDSLNKSPLERNLNKSSL